LLTASEAAGGAPRLPNEAFTSTDVFDWEMVRFFAGGWTCLGRSGDLPDAGDQRAHRLGSEGVLTVRTREGRLSAFYNACRHRGHELLAPGTERNLGAIRCPYHAWVYALTGELAAAPRFGDLDGFDRAAYPLIGVRLSEWRGWAFVDAGGLAPAFERHVGEIEAIVPELEGGVGVPVEDHVVRANWKTVAEAFLDTDRVVAAAHGPSRTGPDEVRRLALFPNLLLGVGPDHVLARRLEPLGPDRTRVDGRVLFAGPVAGSVLDRNEGPVAMWEAAVAADLEASESRDRARESLGLVPIGERAEAFHAIVARGHLEATRDAPDDLA
jgi:nitrite reductase/ring-hydroxylating ferredoxin subunit